MAGVAHASTVSVNGTVVEYAAAPGESNILTFSTLASDVIVDDSVNLTPGAGCVQGADATIAVCSGAGLVRIDADTGDGDGDDTVSISGPITMELHAGDGDDTITGSDGDYALFGDDGVDTINAGEGVDQLEGDAGVDELDGGPGADTLDGGFGSDWVAYASSSGAVIVDLTDPGLDGGSDDGAGDQLSDLENIRGSDHNDTLIGNNIPNEIDGGLGADSINGGADQDIVSYEGRTTPVVVDFGDAGTDGGVEDGAGDTLTSIEGARGGEAGDTPVGDSGANTLDGRGGDDTLNGKTGADVLIGGTGNDTADYSDRAASIVADLDGVAVDGEAGEGGNVVPDVEDILGGAGPDVLRGGGGANRLVGGAGADDIDGFAGPDTIEAGAGNDTIQAKDGTSDVIGCGDGADTLTRDTQDVVVEDCEDVDGGGGFVSTLEEAIALGGIATTPASVAAVKGGVSVNSRGISRLRVKCPKKSSSKVCKGSLRLKTKGKAKKYQRLLGTKKARAVTLAASKGYNVRRGKAKWVRMKLSKKGKKIVFQVFKVKARVLSKSGKGKKSRTRSTTITLKFNKNVRVT
jgi:Ca2+-binding RTX toxin-like protein